MASFAGRLRNCAFAEDAGGDPNDALSDNSDGLRSQNFLPALKTGSNSENFSGSIGKKGPPDPWQPFRTQRQI